MGKKRNSRRRRRARMNRARARARQRRNTTSSSSRKKGPSKSGKRRSFGRRRNVRGVASQAPTQKAVKTTGPGMSMRDKARARHQNFKATGVQTHGGTRKNYTRREAQKIERALGRGSFKTVTRGARNPLGNRQALQNALAMQINTPIGPVADGAQYAQNVTNYGMRFGATPEARAKAYEQSLRSDSFKGLSDGMTYGVGPVASGDAYARGRNADLNNVENRLRAGRNILSSMTRGLVPRVRRLTDKEIADRRGMIARGPRGGARFNSRLAALQGNIARRRGMGNGAILKGVNDAAPVEEVAPVEEAAPVENVVVDPDIKKIQDDAYDDTYNPGGSTPGGGTGGTPGGGGMGGIIAGIASAVGNRGRKRFRYGRRRGGQRLLSRGSDRFDTIKNLPTFTFKGLNI